MLRSKRKIDKTKGQRRSKRPRTFKKGGTIVRRSRVPKPSYAFRQLLGAKIPQYWKVKQRYVTDSSLTTVGGFLDWTFRGNSVYDPDETGVGGQPAGFDLMATMYASYIVFASKITVEVWNSDEVPTIVTIIPATQATDFSAGDYLQKVGTNFYKSITCGPYASSRSHVTLRNFCKTKQMFTVKDPADESSLHAPVNNNPGNQIYWHVLYQNTDGGNLNVYTKISILYYIRYEQPKDYVGADVMEDS